jgi:transcriptional regulator with XRE-family HTH domain
LRRQVGDQLRQFRSDAGLSLRQVAEVSGISFATLSLIERGEREASISLLCAVGEALGADVGLRLYPTTGPRVRDHIQTRIVEEVLRVANGRWKAFVEVPVYRPARGRIDVVLVDRDARVVVAVEVHSQLLRVEQQLGWAALKAESLPSATLWSTVDPSSQVGRLLVLRSTRSTREVVTGAEVTFSAAYGAPARDAFEALTGSVPWPGAALLWANVDADSVWILDRPPRNVRAGR